jgi:hypothetical protein
MRLSVEGPFEPMNVDVLDCVLDVVITKYTEFSQSNLLSRFLSDVVDFRFVSYKDMLMSKFEKYLCLHTAGCWRA